MKAAVIGLGVEGKKAVNSLLKHGWQVYASDLNSNVDLSDLNLSGISLNLMDTNSSFSIISDELTLDVGFTNSQAVYGVNNVSVNWNEQAAKKAKEYLGSKLKKCEHQ